MTDAEQRQQQKVKEFMSLLPLTIELAGLPHGEQGRYYTEQQIEARSLSLKAAYKVARQLVMEVGKP
jgi:hypothetical protein